MAQKLILPINNCKLTASYKNNAYRNKYGWTHYGIDMVSSAGNTLMYASGNGTVVARGWDTLAGNVVVIKYPIAYNRATGRSQDVIFRYYHMNSFHTKLGGVGSSVNKDTPLGYYGGSGNGIMNQWDPHLHIEADTDIKYPCYTPQFSGSGGIIKGTAYGANDQTMSTAINWLHYKPTGPDYQSYTTANDVYINNADKSISVF